MAVWPGHQKINLKCREILNQEVRMLLYVQEEGRNPYMKTNEDTMKSVILIQLYSLNKKQRYIVLLINLLILCFIMQFAQRIILLP
jgi:hypothetical protein